MNTQVIEADPFVKWAGGKRQLLTWIEKSLPIELSEQQIDTYIEPFLGGGAVFFSLSKSHSFKNIILNDLNSELIDTYKMIKEHVDDLIHLLKLMENEYLQLNTECRSVYYYNKRDLYNKILSDKKRQNKETLDIQLQLSSLFVFLNRTCFNGLYRVNKQGFFNVPIGKYANPKICNDTNLRNCSKALENVTLLNDEYFVAEKYVTERTLMYIDPPYRELPNTPSFKSYSESAFNDSEQVALINWMIELVNKKKVKIMYSNSDPKNVSNDDNFFDDLLNSDFKINRVLASRNINSNANKRGEITELLATSYS